MSAEEELARLEAKVLRTAGIGDYLKRVATLRELLRRDSPDVRNIVLAMLSPRVEAQALAAVLDAYGAGARDALSILEELDRLRDVGRIGRPAAETKAIVTGLDREGREAHEKAQRLARAGADLDAVTAPIFAHANTIERRLITAINASGNQGATAVADAAGMATVWVAETNACVTCLAYSGIIAKPGKTFPAGLTYGKRSTVTSPLQHPPAHPHCRCTVEPLRSKEYAAALRREADRSVARGFSLESESMAVRIDAAQRLLDSNPDLPKSVIAYARAAIKRGEFTTRGRP
jgi:hypothetical protein